MENNTRDLYFLGDDKIGRGRYAQNLMEIIRNCDNIKRNNDNESYVIGIDAPWGTGKTQFVSMMKNYLEGKWKKTQQEGESINESTEAEAFKNTGANEPENLDEISTVYYDAWSNDFWNNAFEPFFDCIMNSDCLAKFREGNDLKSFFSAGKNVVKYLLSSQLKKIVGEDNVELLERCVSSADLIDIYDESISVHADGLVTNDPENKVIACCHAGWKNSLCGVIENTVQKMCDRYNCDKGKIIAVILPSIAECCFEVGEEVVNQFAERGFTDFINRKYEKPHIDLFGVNTDILLKSGLNTENIHHIEPCTYCTPDKVHDFLFHSFRRGPLNGKSHLNGMNCMFMKLIK